jgi:hypothetical protein
MGHPMAMQPLAIKAVKVTMALEAKPQLVYKDAIKVWLQQCALIQLLSWITHALPAPRCCCCSAGYCC